MKHNQHQSTTMNLVEALKFFLTTISRALNNNLKVKEEARHVLEMAEKPGHRKNNRAWLFQRKREQGDFDEII